VPKVLSARPRNLDFDIKRPAPAQSRQPSLPAMAVAAAVDQPAPVVPEAPVAVQAAVKRIPLDMELPGGESANHFEVINRRAKWRGLRRGASRGLAVALVLLITMGGLLFSQSYLKLHKVFKGGTGTAAALKANVKPELLKGEGQGRVNILLLGRGGGNHDGPDLTDTMMLVSVDPINHTSTLLSLPRDLWVNVPNQGVMKLNAAWETGEFKYLGKVSPGSTNPKAISAGFSMVDQTVQQVLGVDINYNVLVDFQAFQQAVDTVGGVNVNVPTDLVDPTMAWENGGNSTLAKAGLQDFNGKQALIYVRSRETSSDFARAERQRSVLLALKSKVETLGTLSNPFKLSGLLNSFGNNVQTDLSISNANRLYSIMKNVSGANITSIGLNDTTTPGATQYVATGNINGQSVVLPKAGLFQYGDIQQFVRGQLKDPYIIKENSKIFVLNGTAMPGLATTKANELKSYGYNVTKVGNTPNSGWTQTTLVDLTHGKDKYTKNYLEERLGVKASASLSDTTIPTNGADFVIIIGNDEANPTQN
jgi:LCP family protein required for cell wall assembly